MNPTALLKIIAALIPLMGDNEIGQAMVVEIQAMFQAMQIAAHALNRIDTRLASIEQKLIAMGAPLSDNDVSLLQIGDYAKAVSDAIELGASHNAE